MNPRRRLERDSCVRACVRGVVGSKKLSTNKGFVRPTHPVSNEKIGLSKKKVETNLPIGHRLRPEMRREENVEDSLFPDIARGHNSGIYNSGIYAAVGVSAAESEKK